MVTRGRSVLADTGPLYAAIDRDDQYHSRARDELRELNESGTGVIIAYPILAEVYTLTLYRLGSRRAVRVAEELRDGAAMLNPSPEDYAQALLRVAKHRDLRASLFDGVVTVLAERSGLEVWTYDEQLRVLGATIWSSDQ
jgi:predicted nucleic acid-binding protein